MSRNGKKSWLANRAVWFGCSVLSKGPKMPLAEFGIPKTAVSARTLPSALKKIILSIVIDIAEL